MALKVHVTGVSGLIGDVVYAHLAAQPERYEVTGSGRRYEPWSEIAGRRAMLGHRTFSVFHVSGGTVRTPTGWRRDGRSVARRSGSRRRT